MKLTDYVVCALMGINICACNSENIFDSSPIERVEQQISELQKDLVSAPFGWKIIYFPKTDSLLFSDPEAKVGEFDYQPESFGYGGKFFLMKFTESGQVEMFSDDDDKTVETPVVGAYEVGLNSVVRLSFTTFNYIHSLVNDTYGGTGDFLYEGKDYWGRMMFKTASYLEPAKEYICFERLEEDPQKNACLKRSLENRRFFESLKNPQIRISKGARVFFQSDRYLKRNSGSGLIGKWEKGSRDHRYYVFLYNKKLNPNPDAYPLEVNGLGSGYVGTEDGICFRSGIRYSKDVVFCNFYREGRKMVSELVKVYNPQSRKFFYGDKRMYPGGEFTGYRAEIEDKAIIK